VGVKLFDRKFGKDLADGPPATPGVYLFRDKEGRVLYVGKAKHLRKRLANYRNATRRKVHRKMRLLVRRAASLDIQPLATERDALLKENELIRSLRPPFNVDGAFSFLYPAIGTCIRAEHQLFCFTTNPGAWNMFDFQWYGTFRSRPRAKEAFDVLIELLSHIAHREPKSRLPEHRPIRGSRLVAFRGLSAEVSAKLTAFLAGETAEPLGFIAEALLEKPRARREAERVQECLQRLSAFYNTDLHKLRAALNTAGIHGTFIAQEERDSLFISTT
jgi:excinuclease ABC subunit C